MRTKAIPKKHVNRIKKTKKLTKKIKKITFHTVAKKIRDNLSKSKFKTLNDAITAALKTARKQNISSSGRVIKIPKTGGILPLIPIFAGLSALGALSGGVSGILKAINSAKAAKQELDEAQRHNRSMESIAIGRGLFLKPYKKGLGIFLD